MDEVKEEVYQSSNDSSDDGKFEEEKYKKDKKWRIARTHDLPRFYPSHSGYLEKTKKIPEYLDDPKFLSENFFEKVAMPSYQSSGSTLLRRYIENITGVLTGSDADKSKTLDKQLRKKSKFYGEGVLGKKVWVRHTNFPEEIGSKRFIANKAVVITRNPCDSIFSHFNKILTRRIDRKLDAECMEKYEELWTKFVEQEIDMWKQFHDYWMLEPVIPTYFIRYEDLIRKPLWVLTELFKFLLNTKNIKGTLIEASIKRETVREKEKYYKQNKPGYSFEFYNPELLSYMDQRAGCVIRRLGYDSSFVTPLLPSSMSVFFDNDEDWEISKEHELDIIVKETTEYPVSMRFDYLHYNREVLSIVTGSGYKEKMEEKELDEFKLNYRAEDIRVKGEIRCGTKELLRKYIKRKDNE